MKRIVISALLGGLVGYLYYRFIGCYSGTCSITSNPLNSTVYFALMGGLVGVLFQKTEKKIKKEEAND